MVLPRPIVPLRLILGIEKSLIEAIGAVGGAVDAIGAIGGAVRVEGSGIGAVGNAIRVVSGAIAMCAGYADNLSIWM